MRRFRRLGPDRVQLRLPDAERQLLAQLLPQLRAVLDGDRSVAHLRTRLFPSAYDDDEDEAEYRSLVGDDLVDQRHAALAAALATLERGDVGRGGRWSVELDDGDATAWLSVLQDLRLVLAQIVGITDEDDWEREPPDASHERLILWHVGLMQEEVVAALSSSLDGS